MRILTNVDLTCLQSTSKYLRVQNEVPKLWVFIKATVLVHHQMLAILGHGVLKSAAPGGIVLERNLRKMSVTT